MRNFLLFFLIILIFCASCKKSEEDKESPFISIDSPLANVPFSYGDTIFVSGLITDDQALKSIKISVYDQSKNFEITSSILFYDKGTHFNLNCLIGINDPTLESGVYYLGITADDGFNTKKHFVPIQIAGIERKMLGIVYLSYNGSGPTYVQMIDTLGVETTLLTLDGDYQTSEISSKYGKLFVAGALTGDFNAVELEDKRIAWRIENQTNNVLPWFYNIYVKNSIVYIGTQNESINAYSINGLPIRRYSCNHGWMPMLILEHENRLFAATQNIRYLKPQMAQFYAGSSLFINQQIMDFRPVKMYGKEADYLLIFGNEGNIGKSYRYYFLENAFNSDIDFGTDTIIDVAQYGNNEFLVLTNQGVWHYYSNRNSSVTSSSNFSGGNSLMYEAVGNQYYVVRKNQILMYDRSSGTLKATINTTKEIKKAHLYYNR